MCDPFQPELRNYQADMLRSLPRQVALSALKSALPRTLHQRWYDNIVRERRRSGARSWDIVGVELSARLSWRSRAAEGRIEGRLSETGVRSIGVRRKSAYAQAIHSDRFEERVSERALARKIRWDWRRGHQSYTSGQRRATLELVRWKER